MKKSSQVMLGALFLTTVSSLTAKGQGFNGRSEKVEHSDSSGHYSHGGSSVVKNGKSFFHFFRHNNSQNSHFGNSPGLTHTPRTGGFGNTLRSSGS